jgi:DNA-binding transcriptional MerR regulator
MGGRTGLLSVGEVARRAGLTTKALRHYDRLGVLVPAVVGDDGYRWYAGEQVATARVIARLRALDVPLDVVRVVLGGAAEADIRRHLLTHRNALQARDDRRAGPGLPALQRHVEAAGEGRRGRPPGTTG